MRKPLIRRMRAGLAGLTALFAAPAAVLAQITDSVQIAEHAEDVANYTVEDVFPAIVLLVIIAFVILYALSERPGMLQQGGAKVAILAVGAAAVGIAAAILG